MKYNETHSEEWPWSIDCSLDHRNVTSLQLKRHFRPLSSPWSREQKAAPSLRQARITSDLLTTTAAFYKEIQGLLLPTLESKGENELLLSTQCRSIPKLLDERQTRPFQLSETCSHYEFCTIWAVKKGVVRWLNHLILLCF